MVRLSGFLSACMDRPVLDVTGPEGRYDISFAVSEEVSNEVIAARVSYRWRINSVGGRAEAG
jgi:uncharacterized protein (TIGR03435 family)